MFYARTGSAKLATLVAIALASLCAVARAEESPDADRESRARVAILELLGGPGAQRRAELLESLERLPLSIVAKVLESCGAPPSSPSESGEPHELSIDVPVPAAPRATYLVRLPPGYDRMGSYPVLVAMHHTGGQAQHMHSYWAASTDEHGVILVTPQATVNRNQGWGSTEIELATIMAVIRDVRRRFACDPDRIALTGMSMGGHATWEVGILHGDEFAALFPECGGPRKELVPLVANLTGGLLLWQCQGALDQPELVRAVRMGVERLERLGGSVVYEEAPDRGHVYFPERRDQRLDALLTAHREPLADRIDYLTVGPPASRRQWLEITEIDEDAYHVGDQLKLVFRGEKPTDEEMFEKMWRQIDKRLAKVDAQIDGNKIILRAKRVRRVRLHLDSTRFDPERPILVKAGSKLLLRADVAPSVRTLLEAALATGDRSRRVDLVIDVDL